MPPPIYLRLRRGPVGEGPSGYSGKWLRVTRACSTLHCHRHLQMPSGMGTGPVHPVHSCLGHYPPSSSGPLKSCSLSRMTNSVSLCEPVAYSPPQLSFSLLLDQKVSSKSVGTSALFVLAAHLNHQTVVVLAATQTM